MTVCELNRSQIVSLKESYLCQLAEDGTFGEIVYGDANIQSPAYDDFANADELVPDEIITEHYSDYVFSEDDFN